MNYLKKKGRPLLVLFLGVVFIGIGLILVLNRPPSQVGEFKSGLSEPFIPTPILNLDNSPYLQTVTPSIDQGAYTTPSQPILVPKAEPPLLGRFKAADNRTKFGLEPLGYPLWDRIAAAGKEFPVWINIPSINLDAPILPATLRKVIMEGKTVDMWFAPDYFAPGWHTTSALPGSVGNTVLSGHNNEFGQVFAGLIDLNSGDEFFIITQKRIITYIVTNKVLFQEVEVGLAQRIENARWISSTQDERITLVTCWPKDSNTHRLVIVARPK